MTPIHFIPDSDYSVTLHGGGRWTLRDQKHGDELASGRDGAIIIEAGCSTRAFEALGMLGLTIWNFQHHRSFSSAMLKES